MAEGPVLIVGAGVVGLVLAQALKKQGIAFIIFDRDEHINARGHGWGITIHWALEALKNCLPSSLFEKLNTIQVDPEQGRKDTGQFLFLNVKTAEPVFQIPPSPRLRINREKFRKLLLEGIEVQWNKALENFEVNNLGVVASFKGGSRLPIRFLGATVKLTPSEIEPLRAFDPLLFQGCHPETGTFLWFSTLDTPEVNGSSGSNEYFSAQLNMSWPVKGPGDEVPASNEEKLKKMKEISSTFETRLSTAIQRIPDDTEIMEIRLADWPCLHWPSSDGKVTLIGDAAHAMTMYRGEAANHGITDALDLCQSLTAMAKDGKSLKPRIHEFETEMRERTSWAVLMSRQACLDAHDFSSLNADSAILARRAVKA
ncbi:hypothetical protein IFR04_015182 [Cadophora malorum]|uniref:FAD-binding domain-containing protein n=1 Tax=Cadophora malorum TaxID=108018 RepID=A0A8H7T1A4_9HELO|nr:hypothetical protein IFR04_015182 [Cadophora malorum]